jgi:bacterioferritin
MDRKVVKELNAYLKGEYMAIKAYESFIHRIKDPSMRLELQKIQRDHKQHAVKVSNRIRNLGGIPVKGAGLMGTMSDMKNLVKRNSDDTMFILKDAGAGEYRGIQMAEEVVKGDLDAESLKLIKSLLEEDRGHVGRLSGFIH